MNRSASSSKRARRCADFKTGDRVFVHHHAPCFQCAECRRGEYVQCATWRATNIVPGGMAEFFLVSAANQRDTLRLPDSVADADGVLIEPAACVVKSLKRSGLKAGESILIIGLGIMGMMHVKLARESRRRDDHRRGPVPCPRPPRAGARRRSRNRRRGRQPGRAGARNHQRRDGRRGDRRTGHPEGDRDRHCGRRQGRDRRSVHRDAARRRTD